MAHDVGASGAFSRKKSSIVHGSPPGLGLDRLMHSNMVASDMDDCTMVGHTSTHSKPSQTLPSGAGPGARKRSSPAFQAAGEIEL